MTQHSIPTPYYIVYEHKLRSNLELIDSVRKRAGVDIIMAFKANALWRTFHIIEEYRFKFTASSLNEMRLGNEYLHTKAHSYCPAYTEQTIDRYIAGSSHITFNSLSQLSRFGKQALEAGVSTGLRVNPQCSVIETDIYNPALPGSRFGVTAQDLDGTLPEYVEGFHFHALCESGAEDLQKVLEAFETQFGQYLPHLKWVNMGGGHLMTRKGYNIDLLVNLLTDFRQRYPWLEIILEPGSAFTWRTGDLITSVVDTVCNQGVRTAIIDASFACHMPDTLEMPYTPIVSESKPEAPGLIPYRLGGNSCLSGDFAGPWYFDHELQPGERLTLEDMNHYTTVKTNMFNGIQHPAILLQHTDGQCEYLRKYDFEDYLKRMD
ncbi:MAG: carboxynorspermidine decarboxylase [Paramuribaculum sp.]|nr:carboxynorspermidine decarboxylase [Paramuribaculum sp.]